VSPGPCRDCLCELQAEEECPARRCSACGSNRLLVHAELHDLAMARAKDRRLAGHTVKLKLKRADHRLLTRRQSLAEPTQLADRVYRIAEPLLHRDLGAGPFRLIGIGLSMLVAATHENGDLADPAADTRGTAERAADCIRARWGADAIRLGRALK
jgi:DNA polymerase IV